MAVNIWTGAEKEAFDGPMIFESSVAFVTLFRQKLTSLHPNQLSNFYMVKDQSLKLKTAAQLFILTSFDRRND